MKTRRERLKSALYLRLRKRKTLFLKKLNIHSVAKYQISKKLKGDPLEEKIFFKSFTMPKNWKGGLRGFSTSILSQNMKKYIFPGKNLTMPKKLKGGTLWDFSTSILSQNIKKCRGTLWGRKFPKKMSRSAEKNWKGDPLVLPGMVGYAKKQGKPFWSSSLGQMVQFDTIIFGRTFKNYFGQFVWIE